jgi:hypothetical protein
LERPLLPNRVLKVLDRVTVEVFDYAPELNIGNEVAAETGLYETLRQSGGDKAKARAGQWAASATSRCWWWTTAPWCRSRWT